MRERVLTIPSEADRADLAMFVGRAIRLDEAAVVRLKRRSDGRVSVWAPTGFDALATRVVAGDIRPADTTAAGDELLRAPPGTAATSIRDSRWIRLGAAPCRRSRASCTWTTSRPGFSSIWRSAAPHWPRNTAARRGRRHRCSSRRFSSRGRWYRGGDRHANGVRAHRNGIRAARRRSPGHRGHRRPRYRRDRGRAGTGNPVVAAPGRAVRLGLRRRAGAIPLFTA